MMTKELIDKFYEDVESLNLRFPVAAIAEGTGEKKGNVSEYLSKKKVPSQNFIEKFYEKFYPERQKAPRLEELLLGLVDLVKDQKKIIENQDKKIEAITSSLNGLFGNQQVFVAKQQAALEVLLRFQMGELPNRSAKELLDIADKAALKLQKEKRKDTHSGVGNSGKVS